MFKQPRQFVREYSVYNGLKRTITDASNGNRIIYSLRREYIRFRLSPYVLLSRGNLLEFPKDTRYASRIEYTARYS